MKDIDRLIDQAIDEEERELLHRIGEEPGFFDQALGLFGGRTGWVNLVLTAVQTALFLAGVWTAWMFFEAGDPVSQLRWGLPAAVLLLVSLMLKMALWPVMRTNQVLRELKIVQLQLVQLDGGGRAAAEPAE